MKTILHYYRFNVENVAEKQAYNELKATLKAKGLELFDSISSGQSEWYKKIKELDGQTIELETEHLFNNQWNTAPIGDSKNGLIVFDWSEAIYPNKRIKEGMYLEQTNEMIEIRNNTYKCNYCGKNHYLPEKSFCESCIGSEYLTEDNLPLLFLTPISQDRINTSAVIVPESLIERFKVEHKKTMSKKLESRKVNKLESLQKDIVNAQKEYDAFKCLIELDIDFENVIYYSHTDKFCFGWRNAIPMQEAEKIESKLINSGFTAKYNVQFKTC